eukprot:TRINITY_DN9439_c0_g1_i1.p1 TRINITY_DN9439_c0_g1~~TRINITY_DN9439_c0_g1_i1.p1  ORF type:complete len:671 (-),score=94.61 TRINITY_DN9439_c0_g1_i1:45-2057(-)
MAHAGLGRALDELSIRVPLDSFVAAGVTCLSEVLDLEVADLEELGLNRRQVRLLQRAANQSSADVNQRTDEISNGSVPSGSLPSAPSAPSGSPPTGSLPSGSLPSAPSAPSGSLPDGSLPSGSPPSAPIASSGSPPDGSLPSGRLPSAPSASSGSPPDGSLPSGSLPSRACPASASRTSTWEIIDVSDAKEESPEGQKTLPSTSHATRTENLVENSPELKEEEAADKALTVTRAKVRTINGITYPRDVECPDGFPPGWKGVEQSYGEGSQLWGMTYTRWFSLDGKHKSISTAKLVMKLHCEDHGLDFDTEYAKYKKIVKEKADAKAKRQEEEREVQDRATADHREKMIAISRSHFGELNGATVFGFPGWRCRWEYLPRSQQAHKTFFDPEGREFKLLKDVECMLGTLITQAGGSVPSGTADMVEAGRTNSAAHALYHTGHARAKEIQGSAELTANSTDVKTETRAQRKRRMATKSRKRRKTEQAKASSSGKTGRSIIRRANSKRQLDECILEAKKSVLALLDFDSNQRGGGGTDKYRSHVEVLREDVAGLQNQSMQMDVTQLIDAMDEGFSSKTCGTYRVFVPFILRALGASKAEVQKQVYQRYPGSKPAAAQKYKDIRACFSRARSVFSKSFMANKRKVSQDFSIHVSTDKCKPKTTKRLTMTGSADPI